MTDDASAKRSPRPTRSFIVISFDDTAASYLSYRFQSFSHRGTVRGRARGAHAWHWPGELIARGHEVSLFAAPGSDRLVLRARELGVEAVHRSAGGRVPHVGARPEQWMREHHAYLKLMLDLGRDGASGYDIVHNNSLHHLPVAMAS